MSAQLSQVQFKQDIPVTSSAREQFSHPFYFELDNNCRPGKFAFHQTISKENQRKIKGLFDELQFVIPYRAGIKKWKSQERDSIGRYEALYTVVKADDEEMTLVKEKTDYSKVTKPRGAPKMAAEIHESKTKAILNSTDPWFEDLTSTQKLTLIINDMPFVEIENSLSLSRMTPALTLNLPADKKKTAFDYLPFEETDPIKKTKKKKLLYQTDYPQRDLSGRSLDSILKEFVNLFKMDDPNSKKEGLDMMVQYLRTNPEASAKLIEAIKENELPKKNQSMAFLALELAGNKPSQNALMKVLEDSEYDSMNRMRAALALKDVTIPQPGVLDVLLEQTNFLSLDDRTEEEQDVSRTSALALGSFGRKSKIRDPASTEAAELKLLELLERESRPSEVALLLRALGNTRNRLLVDRVAPYITSDYPNERSASANALGMMGGVQAEIALLDQLQNEKSVSVRRAIVKSLSHLNQPSKETMNRVGDILLEEKNPGIRAGMIRFLGPHSTTNKELAVNLVEAFENETNADNLKLIGRYLSVTDLNDL